MTAGTSLRIAVVSHLKYPIAEPFPGGLEMHTHMLARLLKARGHDVTLFASEGSDAALNLRTYGAPTGTPTTDKEAEDVALAEHRAYDAMMDDVAAGNFDIVHNNALHYLPLTAASRIKAPMVTVFHTPPFMELENGVLECTRPDMRYIAVSQAVKAMWKDVAVADEVICNGIDLDLFAARTETPIDRPAGRHAVWSGRIVPEKGTDLAIRAARRAGIPLRFAGPISNLAFWHEKIVPLLGEDVTYLGHLNHRELAGEVARAAVALITPRFDEPYGLVVAEALACGTPIAGFARGALPELTDAETGCLAPPDDVETLADCIPRAAALSRAACRARAAVNCDMHRMVGRYEALYHQEIARAAAAGALAAK
ncbi:glycosyltransferase [Roseomonas populi]|uniref:Glycosyltransferase n=1 Tax=Roseomonas populi TaxID=3121582 RepID=A0ABT1XBS5_9PROT|nr:glycosyltransferase [Roseomonas pecuniae]MCR0984572.1 glycosyltransferase [Roseomonas pecuniae]